MENVSSSVENLLADMAGALHDLELPVQRHAETAGKLRAMSEVPVSPGKPVRSLVPLHGDYDSLTG